MHKRTCPHIPDPRAESRNPRTLIAVSLSAAPTTTSAGLTDVTGVLPDRGTLALGLALALCFLAAAVVLRAFGEDFARRTRPRIYTVPGPHRTQGEANPGNAGHPDDNRHDAGGRGQGSVTFVVLVILAIIAAALVLGIKF